MKKAFALLLVMLITVSCVLCGCGKKEEDNSAAPDLSGSQYVGTWKAVKAVFNEKEVPLSDVLQKDFIVTLREDGTASVTGDDGDSEANWSETSDGFKVKGDDIDMSFKNKDGQVYFGLFGVNIFFEKQ